ncbi:MAG TPA: thiamine pyrophosphate-binding protein [Chloroflexota bacterium]|nr:thiamine pyrophosphate-binding protein [Chloroflexota bacterium]
MAAQSPTQAPAVTGRSVAEFVVAQLGLWGVQHMFGVQGRSILGLLDALRRQDAIRYVETRDEGAAALMASAYAKLTGRLSVCVGSTGPGVTNLLTGLYDAQADGAPVLALCGEDCRGAIGRGAYQAIDQHALFETSSHFNHDLMDPRQTPELLMLASKAAIERQGVARLGIPSDVEREMVNGRLIGPSGHLVQERWTSPAQRVAEAVELLSNATRPVVLVGRGARHSRDAVARCASTFDAPVVTTCPAKGSVAEQYPLSMGVVGRFGTSLADDAVRQADVLLVVGCSLSENTTEGWTLISDATRVIQIDTDSSRIGRNHAVTLPLVGDAFLTLEEINRQAKPVQHPDYVKSLAGQKRDWTARIDQQAQSDHVPILPQRVIHELAQTCADDAIIALDVGDHAVFYCQQFPVRNQTTLVSGRMGVMGFSIPAANAAKLAFPARQAIALCGDGGFSSIMGEFLTAMQYKLPIVVVLMDNDELGMARTEQEHDQFQPAGYYTKLAGCDYAAFASACGGMGCRVSQPAQLRQALENAFMAGIPSLVQVNVDPNARPSFQG